MPKTLEERRQTLLEMQRRFRHLAGEFRDEVIAGANADQGIDDSSGGSSDSEYADAATQMYDSEFALTMRFRYNDRLADVTSALRRVETGEYGRCTLCQAPISEARLDAVPETPYCLDHAFSHEATDNQPGPTPKPWPNPPMSA